MTLDLEIDDALMPALRRWIDKQVTAKLVNGQPVIERHYADEEDALIGVLQNFLAGIAQDDPTPAMAVQLATERQARSAFLAAVRPRRVTR